MNYVSTQWVIRRFRPVLCRRRYSDASFFSDVNKLKKHHSLNSQNTMGSRWGLTKINSNSIVSNGERSGLNGSSFRGRHGTNGVSHPRNGSNSNWSTSATLSGTLNGPNKSLVKMQQILKHQKAYDLFMHHLWKEHSSECLLSCTEFVHFQYLIVFHHDAMDGNLDIIDDAKENLVRLHPDIPQSSIVFGDDPSNRVSEYMHNKWYPPNVDTMYKKHRIGSSRFSSQFSGTLIKGLNAITQPSKAMKIRHGRGNSRGGSRRIKKLNHSNSAPTRTSGKRLSGTANGAGSNLPGLSPAMESKDSFTASAVSITASQTMVIVNGNSKASAKAKRSTMGHAKSCSQLLASRINLEQVNEPIADLRMPSNFRELELSGIAEEEYPRISSHSTDGDGEFAVRETSPFQCQMEPIPTKSKRILKKEPTRPIPALPPSKMRNGRDGRDERIDRDERNEMDLMNSMMPITAHLSQRVICNFVDFQFLIGFVSPICW